MKDDVHYTTPTGDNACLCKGEKKTLLLNKVTCENCLGVVNVVFRKVWTKQFRQALIKMLEKQHSGALNIKVKHS